MPPKGTEGGQVTDASAAIDEPPYSPEVHAISTPPPTNTNGHSVPPPGKAENGSSEEYMALSDADVYVIKRLSTRVNVLPIISRADTLTNERLEEVKSIIRRDLKKGGFSTSGILGQLDSSGSDEEADSDNVDGDEDDDDEGEDDEDASRSPRTVVRIRSTRGGPELKHRTSFSQRSRSRTRAALTDEDMDFELTGAIFPKGVRSIRALFPFAVMAPDPVPSISSANANGHASYGTTPTTSPPPPSAYRRRSVTLDATDHLKELQGKYTRNYRWGSVDVLSEF